MIRDFSDYFFESLTATSTRVDAEDPAPSLCLQLTSRCNARCFFCSEHNNPWKRIAPRERSFEEIQHILFSADPATGNVELSRTLPGRISEGEPTIHSQFEKIIYAIRGALPEASITIDTNGAAIDAAIAATLSNVGNVILKLSVPSVTKEVWLEMFGVLKEEHYNNAMSLLYNWREGITVIPNTVIMPRKYGNEQLRGLAGTGAAKLTAYTPGYTKFTDEGVARQLQWTDEEVCSYVDEVIEDYDIEVEWALDPRLPLFMPSLRGVFKELPGDAILLCSSFAYRRMLRAVSEWTAGLPVEVQVVEVKNKVYGGNIGSAGLWFVADIADAVSKYKGEILLYPTIFLDKYGCDLTYYSMVQLEKFSPNTFIGLEV